MLDFAIINPFLNSISASLLDFLNAIVVVMGIGSFAGLVWLRWR